MSIKIPPGLIQFHPEDIHANDARNGGAGFWIYINNMYRICRRVRGRQNGRNYINDY